MKIIYIFCHGWGLDADFWDPLRPYFATKQSIYLDSGYLGTHKISIPQASSDIIFIGIAHSLGLIKLLRLGIKFAAIIGIQSFLNFLGSSNLLYKRRQLELKKLEHDFLSHPKKCLINFYNNNNLQYKKFSKTININSLSKDLKLLYNDFSSILPQNMPLLIIGAANDVVVPVKLMLDNFSIINKSLNIIIYKAGQHNLCWHYSDMLFNDINNFLTNIDIGINININD